MHPYVSGVLTCQHTFWPRTRLITWDIENIKTHRIKFMTLLQHSVPFLGAKIQSYNSQQCAFRWNITCATSFEKTNLVTVPCSCDMYCLLIFAPLQQWFLCVLSLLFTNTWCQQWICLLWPYSMHVLCRKVDTTTKFVGTWYSCDVNMCHEIFESILIRGWDACI